MTSRTMLDFLKVEHSLFSLPFVLSGFYLGYRESGGEWLFPLLWTLIAAVSARSAAMSLNRLIDARIDSRNPRTRGRALPAGRMRRSTALVLVLIFFTLLFAASYLLNPLCLALAPVLVALFAFYPYTKRFTAGSHFVLGLCLAASPVAGYIAVTGTFSGALPTVLLAGAVLFWVAGFDIVYATLDVRFDRREGLKSIPAVYGVRRGLAAAQVLHGLTLGPLALVVLLVPVGYIYVGALGAVAVLLGYEHALADPSDPEAVNRAFFGVNAVIGWVLFAGLIAP